MSRVQVAYAITPEQRDLIVKAERAVLRAQTDKALVLTAVLAGHGVTDGHVVGITDNALTVEVSNED